MYCVHVATATQEEKVLPFSFKYSAFAPPSTSLTRSKLTKGAFLLLSMRMIVGH
jgi:hypothetical protein